MRLSDLIAQRILELLAASDGIAEIQRNELAAVMGCVPSQINYVLSSRFTPEQGFMVESRRGGGGYIRITRVHLDRGGALMHLINSLGGALEPAAARAILTNLQYQQLISPEAMRLMLAALDENAYRECPPALRDRLRASIFKQMLLTLI